jgi:hypothetical protein
VRQTIRTAVCNMLLTIIVNYRLCGRFSWCRLALLDYVLTVRTASVITGGPLNHVGPQTAPRPLDFLTPMNLPKLWLKPSLIQEKITNMKSSQKKFVFNIFFSRFLVQLTSSFICVIERYGKKDTTTLFCGLYTMLND